MSSTQSPHTNIPQNLSSTEAAPKTAYPESDPYPRFAPPDHVCDHQGVPDRFGVDDWFVTEWDIPGQIALHSAEMVSGPLRLAHTYFTRLMAHIAEPPPTQEIWEEYLACEQWARIFEDARSEVEKRVIAAVLLNFLYPITSLQETLQAGLANAGLCCAAAAEAMILEALDRPGLIRLQTDRPDFDLKWLTFADLQRESDHRGV